MANARHSIEIDDWIWEWAQEKFGLKNPASHLRAILSKSVADEKNLTVEKEDEKGRKHSVTPFIAKRTSICPRCMRTLDEGQQAVAAKGEYLHAKCYNESVET